MRWVGMIPGKKLTENQRLEVLRRYAILDTPPEEVFDRITRLAARHFGTPIATVTFVDATRQWFKSVTGLDVRQTGRDVAFCHHTIKQNGVFEVCDSLTDSRFCSNPLVTRDPCIRYYAGAPLITPDGARLGTISVIDRQPRPCMDPADRQFLEDLARSVVHELEMRLAATHVQMEMERRRRAEDELRMANQRIGLALSSVPVTLFTQDRALRYSWIANPPPGLVPEDFVGRTDDDLWPGPSAAELRRIKQAVLDGGQSHRQDMGLNLDGRARVFDARFEPLRDAAGMVTGLMGATIDVTEVRAAQRALQRAYAAADQANQDKSRFLAAASHDLRQPFQAMRLFCDILLGQLTDPRDHATAEKLSEALAAGETLLRALLDVSVLDAGILRPVFAPVALGPLLSRLCQEYQPLAERKGLRIRVVPCRVLVQSDPLLLERLLRNLVNNAVKFTSRGGILLGVRRRRGHVLVEVWDTGIGMEAKALPSIFEDFVQLGNSERDRRQGLGLGLSIVRRMGQLLGHEVSVRSRSGQGTVFSIRLSATDAECEDLRALG